jgi:SOS-response transcriptional repressor LexA
MIKGEHNFALRVKGDSMEPEFNEGDIIVSPTAKAGHGDYVEAKNDEEEATFKWRRRGISKTTFFLYVLLPNHLTSSISGTSYQVLSPTI